MNERKDIFERVKYIMKDDSEIKVNCSKLARQLNCDRRTVSRYIDITKSGKIMNFNHTDYLEIARNSSLKRFDEDEITAIAERNLEIYDKL